MKTFTLEKKTALLTEIEKHRQADQILQGTYGKEESGIWRGCAVGCSIHSLSIMEGKDLKTSDHHLYETELGIPEALAHLEDRIFEGLPKEKALLWPGRFIQAVSPEADLSLVLPKFYLKLLIDKEHGVKQYALEDGKKAIDMVVKVHRNHIKTGSVDESAWSAAESAAWSAAESAAESAAWSAAESARSAAESAAESARSAAESARSAAESAHHEWLADVLVKILEETK